MFAASKTSAVSGSPPAPSVKGAYAFTLNGAQNGFNQCAMLNDGRIVTAIVLANYVGFQIFNTDNTLSGSAKYKTAIPNGIPGIAVDASNYIYLGATNWVYKCDTSGNIIWSLTNFPTSHQLVGFLGCRNGKLAFTTRTQTGSSFNSYVFQVDTTTGLVDWCKLITKGGTLRVEITKCEIDSSGNVFVGGLYGSYNSCLLKFNNAGTLLWEKRFGFDTTCMMVNPPSGYSLLVSYNTNKARVFDSSGTCIAGQDLSGSTTYTFRFGYVHTDGSYVIGARDTSNVGFSMLRFAANGTLMWKRRYYFTAYTTNTQIPNYMTLDSNGNYVLTGQYSTSGASTFINGLYIVMDPATGIVNASSSTWTESTTVGFTYTSSTLVVSSVTAGTISTYTSALTLSGASTLGSSGTMAINVQS